MGIIIQHLFTPWLVPFSFRCTCYKTRRQSSLQFFDFKCVVSAKKIKLKAPSDGEILHAHKSIL